MLYVTCDMLHVTYNRMHNDKCCLEHSKSNGFSYHNDYCHCNTDIVHRSLDMTIK